MEPLPKQARAELRLGAWFELASTQFRHFARLFWPEAVPSAPEPVWSWYLDVICDEVQALFAESARRELRAWEIRHSEEAPSVAAELINDELGRLPRLWLVIEVGPRLGKSSLIQRLLVAWIWAQRARTQILSLAGTPKIVERDGVYLRELISSPKYQLFLKYMRTKGAHRGGTADPEWALREDQNAKSKFDTSLGGTRQGYSITSKFTGADSDVTLVDDPYDVEEVLKGTPERIAQRMGEVVQTFRDKVQDRRNNPIWHVTVLIMQRLHDQDLAGWMGEQEGARVVCLPSLHEPEHPRAYQGDPRQPGESISPLRLPRGLLERLQAESPWMFGCKHQQRPTAKAGGQIRESWFRRRYVEDPKSIAARADEVWVTSDAAKKGKATNDFHAIQVWARIGAERYLLDRRTERMGYPEYERAMDAMQEKWEAWRTGTLIEDTANGTTYIQFRRATVPDLVAFSPTRDTPGKDKSKAARAVYIERAAEADQVILPDARILPGVETWLECVCAFPMGANDDDVDAASQLFLRWSEPAEDWGVTLVAG